MNKTQLWTLVGIPILLFLISIWLLPRDEGVDNALSNRYIKETLNNDYIKIIEKNKGNDSTFFCSVTDRYAIRELVVFKKFPKDFELKTEFTVKLYPERNQLIDKSINFLRFDIINDGVKLNYNGEVFGVFKTPIPIIDLEKIEVENNSIGKNFVNWKVTQDNPFLSLNIDREKSVKRKDSFSVNPYHYLIIKVLNHYNISNLPNDLKNNSFLERKTLLDNFASNKKLTFSYIEKTPRFWYLINKKDKRLVDELTFNGPHKLKVDELKNKYVNGTIPLEMFFDIDKLTKFKAVKHVFTSGCDDDISFIFNEKTNLVEPFFVNSSCLGEMGNSIKKPIISNPQYLEKYISTIERVASANIYEDYIKEDIEFQKELYFINLDYPEKIFNYDILEINQRIIKKSINGSQVIMPELLMMNEETIVVSIFNSLPYPIEIIELLHKKNKKIKRLDSIRTIKSYKTDTIVFSLPASFRNLFVDKKNKTTGFKLYKDIYDLNISYKISGLNENYRVPIMPYEQKKPVDEDLFRMKKYVNNHEKLFVDEGKKIITFFEDSVSISSPLIIPKGYIFSLKPGNIINIIDGGKIISYSPLNFLGTKEKPIKIYSSDRKGQGILIQSEGRKSTLKHVDFDHLGNPNHGFWSISGAVTFYESPTELEFVSIKNNRCEDALNIVRTNFSLKHVTISNTQSDAFDGDFVNGTLLNCLFDNLGNDAIDVSGSELIIKNVIISNAGDKGLSAGENSKMNIDTVEISNSEIAVAGKDLSIVDAKNLKIKNTKLGFTAFQKKPEFGPSKITVSGVTMIGVETKYLIESSSSLFVDGEKIKTTQNVKDRMYGVEFGVSSKDTRNAAQ